MQDLNDFDPPEAFQEIINTIQFMSLEEARTALKYEGLYNFLQRPRVLRIQLRRIASKLGRVQSPDPSWDKLAAQEQRLEIRKYLMKTLPTIRSAYADMTAFADNVNEYISTIYKEQDQIPEQLLKRYQSADDQHKTELAKELFAQGMSMEDPRMLDEAHFTKHFMVLRSLINLRSQQEICQRLGSFGKGLQEMREKLEFKELVIDEDEEMIG
jgi:Mg2+ and Co2+ transporter CorA